MKGVGVLRDEILQAMMAEWLRQGCNSPCGWRDSYKFFLGTSVDRDLINQSVCLGESLKLSLYPSFTLDSEGSNPSHSIKVLI